MRAELYHPLRFDLPRVVHYTAGTLMGLVTLDSRNLDYSRSQEFCRLLEDGEILFFPRSPIQLADEDISFPVGPKAGQGWLSEEHRLQTTKETWLAARPAHLHKTPGACSKS